MVHDLSGDTMLAFESDVCCPCVNGLPNFGLLQHAVKQSWRLGIFRYFYWAAGIGLVSHSLIIWGPRQPAVKKHLFKITLFGKPLSSGTKWTICFNHRHLFADWPPYSGHGSKTTPNGCWTGFWVTVFGGSQWWSVS